ncbi:UDP-N-acetylmuramate:L-alanyl-gamma-D-glutamyl-meso-diaminopimelate ligase [Halorhodospira halochloris]|uniref:UDP-N-acetylmuramate--L-alanyl-gamma-D-glutamyl-meso-2,6-diaminoheptandioate ligase n=1 Tax=Halorhodospira halochloris TaxID=1052 RepID=A0A0X8XAF5_HALHR|nr:UDP-N-acetylmuramate:L-alanyl-gamma-D-glutamyl-meso-diaminopimelate ligase [Halorhodospira halochloris]MBK1652158.1 UDP-N-acetylmuramate:L-alanyl-gamma-D-glutamyl-meso-diaminopimelate ligase [Halorhodospira halochloris]MCG5547832.1 UDP-N-acetylmuramate:L-alanyl-gamma-D-glutamyl-meso-diaminopimelate ligase [Halorhodospira halochloris]BAU58424.1 UDP-N-acetylmuramate:L-alanyl-gamma-D-glutamyl-meso-diaminopimelate ligase [Halorhodospira halochloris]
MRVHILGICGTFMGGVALLARDLGYAVSGSDAAAWPPMSDILVQADITVHSGYSIEHLEPPPDAAIIGNALTRGNPAIEYILDRGINFSSGPEWLAANVLKNRCPVAISGTHGKTTTAAMTAWALELSGFAPGFLIGGAPCFSERSARLGTGSPFVVEADEYDTAFFDKRAKVVHYRPRVLTINNLEYDHADIYPNLESIATQLHHAVRTVPPSGRVLVNGDDPNIDLVLRQGCWSNLEKVGTGADNDWRICIQGDKKSAQLTYQGSDQGEINLPQPGLHNMRNAAMAVAAANAVGVCAPTALQALKRFPGVKRRLELRGSAAQVDVIDDFAHHPSAIQATLEALREANPQARIVAVLEPRSRTMQQGVHRDRLATSLEQADLAFVLSPTELTWSVADALAPLGEKVTLASSTSALCTQVLAQARPGDKVVIMSNGDFGGIHEQILGGLQAQDGQK